MSNVKRTACCGALAGLMLLGWIILSATVGAEPAAQTAPASQAMPAGQDVPPPEGQTYTGSKRCASCHFKQFMAWKKTNHSKSFELLPAKYQKDPKCLKCHTTGYGEATGYKDGGAASVLAGTTCEACHGPGSKHEEVAQAYGKAKLTPAQEKIVRDSCWLVMPGNVCIKCHVMQGHHESQTPPELRKK
jgi:hypothetical protein